MNRVSAEAALTTGWMVPSEINSPTSEIVIKM